MQTTHPSTERVYTVEELGGAYIEPPDRLDPLDRIGFALSAAQQEMAQFLDRLDWRGLTIGIRRVYYSRVLRDVERKPWGFKK